MLSDIEYNDPDLGMSYIKQSGSTIECQKIFEVQDRHLGMTYTNKDKITVTLDSLDSSLLITESSNKTRTYSDTNSTQFITTMLPLLINSFNIL